MKRGPWVLMLVVGVKGSLYKEKTHMGIFFFFSLNDMNHVSFHSIFIFMFRFFFIFCSSLRDFFLFLRINDDEIIFQIFLTL